MAKKADSDDELSTPKRGKKLVVMIMLLLALMVLAGGGYMGAACFMKLPPFEPSGPTPEELAAQQAAAEAAEAAKTRDMYVKFDQPFTFNLSYRDRAHTAQVDVVLVVSGPDNEALAKKHRELLSSTILNKLSAENYAALLMPSGRERLKIELLDALRGKMSEVARAPVVEKVLFTAFVMQ